MGILIKYSTRTSAKLRAEIVFQVDDIMKICDGLLSDLSGYKSVHQQAMELVEELHNWNQDAFSEWSREMTAQIDDKNAPLRFFLFSFIKISHSSEDELLAIQCC